MPQEATSLFKAGAKRSKGFELYEKSSSIPGFFGIDDAMHFSLVLGIQNATLPPADILEIGTYFGRSAGFLASYIRPGERLRVCDAYTRETEDHYEKRPTIDDFRQNVRQVAPEFDQTNLEIYDCLSSDLKLPSTVRLRCAHIDGGHSRTQCLFDLELVAPHVVPGGVIICDDYLHTRWPGVTEAVGEFLEKTRLFTLAAAVNRRQAVGQKCYLVRIV